MKIKIKGYVHWNKYDWRDESDFQIWPTDMSDTSPNRICVGEREFEVEIPDDFDPRPLQIESLRKEKQRVQAEAQFRVNNLDEQIQKLLCLEFKPGAE